MKTDRDRAAQQILEGKTALGIEFGSTRIKAVLLDEDHRVLATGAYDWENRFEDGLWTYTRDDILSGLAACYADLKKQVQEEYGTVPRTYGVMGISGMMHGYLALDRSGEWLAPFYTWRNNHAEDAAEELSGMLDFHVPARWSVAHLYRAMCTHQEHLQRLDYLTTLSGYVHLLLTGERVLGVGDASGMFPTEAGQAAYDAVRMSRFTALTESAGVPWRPEQVLPQVLAAGADAGRLTATGASLIDPTGDLRPGIPFCPPEGDAGTGMVATDSVAVRRGNVSAGTSVFAMFVLEHALSAAYPEVDMVATPDGAPVAMVHCNNCTSELNAWVRLFGEFAALLGHPTDTGALYPLLFRHALLGAPDCDGALVYNYTSGENLTRVRNGCPALFHTSGGAFTLADFMRAQLYGTFATLKIGLDILMEREGVRVDSVCGHGGLFKTPGVCQLFLASALGTPVTVHAHAGEGGAWGMALLAAYSMWGTPGETLSDYLERRVFAGQEVMVEQPDAACAAGFSAYMQAYRRILPALRLAADGEEDHA